MKNEALSSVSFPATQENSNFYDYYHQAEDLYESYKNKEANNFFSKAVEELPLLAEKPPQKLLVKLYFYFGLTNSRLGNYKEAIENYKEAIENYELSEEYEPNETTVMSKLGESYFKLGEYKEAADYCDKIIELNPSIMRAYYNKGNMLLNLAIRTNLEDKEIGIQAIKCYKQALEIKVDGYEEIIYQIYTIEKKEIPALTKEENTILSKEIAEIIAWKGNVSLIQFKDIKKSLADYDKALEIDNNCLGALIGKGRVFISMNKMNEALMIYDKALEIDNSCLEALIAKQQILVELERFEEVIEVCDKMLEILPEHEEILQDKIRALLIINQDDEGYKSEEDNSESLLLDIEKVEVNFSYGIIYKKEHNGHETDESTPLGCINDCNDD